jgi:multidrug efflux pump
MNFTDIFIRKPVLATTVSLLILVLGLRSVTSLSVRQYPRTQNAVVTVSTTYYGADAQTVAGFITQPLEAAIAQAQGIDYMSSTSSTGVSTIQATLRLNYEANKALTEINTQVNFGAQPAAARIAAAGATVQVRETIDSMYMGFFSDVLENNGVTDHPARRQAQAGLGRGRPDRRDSRARQFALRAWLDWQRMAAYGVTASDVRTALANNNYLAALGTTKGQMVSVDLTAGTSLHTVDEFKQLAVRQKDGAIVRLQDVANVVLGAENYDFTTAFGGRNAVFIGIKVAPEANVLEVTKRVRDVFPEIQAQMPNGITGEIVYDGTKFIRSSIDEVEKTLIQALIIVSIVILLFLGSIRAVVIPLIAMPLSLIGAFFVMLILGYSINLLTLLALVLAIGLVVDDAIIVVENVDRHMKEGSLL